MQTDPRFRRSVIVTLWFIRNQDLFPFGTRWFTRRRSGCVVVSRADELGLTYGAMASKAGFTTGKLPPALMVKLLRTLGNRDPSVKLGPAMGEDAAAIRLDGSRYLIAKTDPITFTTHRAAELLLQVNANDLATRGSRPRYLQVAAFFPPGTTAREVTRHFRELHSAAKKLGVTITGGHTEVTSAVTRPVLVGNMLGFVPARRLISTGGAKAGDILVMAGAAGIEGSAILAYDRARQIERALGRTALRAAQRLATAPGTSVLRAGLIAAAAGVHAMHDPTEGGVGAAIHEMAYAAGLCVRVDLDRVLVLAVTRDICRIMGIDPLGLTSSGALLIAVSPTRARRLVDALTRAGIAATAIGGFEAGRGVRAMRAGKPARLPWFKRDEILRVPEEESRL
jgi:hydrogenase expression/formation protein HypE